MDKEIREAAIRLWKVMKPLLPLSDEAAHDLIELHMSEICGEYGSWASGVDMESMRDYL